MDEEKKEAEKIDIFGPATIFAFVAAFIGDFTFFLVLTHYLCGIFVLAMFFPKSKGFLAKGVLLLAFLLPLPTLMLGIFLAIILSNKVIAFIAEQAAIQVIAAATAGAGEALEGAAAAEMAVGAGAAATEAGAAAAETAGTTIDMVQNAEGVWEAAQTGTEVAGVGSEAATGAAEAGEAAEGMAETGEAAEGIEEAEKGESTFEKAKDIKEKLEKLKGEGGEEKEENPEDEELDLAATGEERALLGEKGRLNEEFFEQPMQIPTGAEEEEEMPPQNAVSGEKFREAQKIQDIKRQQGKLKPIQQAPVEEDKPEDNPKKAA